MMTEEGLDTMVRFLSHPLSAVPIADPFVEETREHILLKREVPSPLNPPPGCAFHPRGDEVIPECSQTIPPLREVGNGHEVTCIRVCSSGH